MAGTSLSVVSSASANRGGVPAWIGTPTVRGKNEVDRKLSVQVSQSMWTYTPTLKWARPVLSWQWKRNGTAISGATDPVYVTSGSDLGTAITCTVTLTGENGTASVTTGTTFTSLDFDNSNPVGTFFTNESTYSNTIGANTITTTFDLVALGVFKSSKTTGSITGGSTSLVVASATGFTIGDKIIVETGGEAGAGAIGTKGVGGTWPALSYADATAMNADTTQVDGKVCWLESTARVYYWNDAGNVWVQISSDLFYIYRVIPKALLATITNIVGTTITLNTAASVSSTGANVYFDCTGKIGPYTDILVGATRAPKVVYISTGEYAFSAYSPLADGMKDIVVEGDGSTATIFVSPNGCSNINMQVATTQRSIFRKFGFRGNHKLNSWARSRYNETDWYDTYIAFAQATRAQICSDVLFDDVRALDAENQAIVYSVSVDSFIRNCSANFVAPIRVYVQWVYNAADSSNCGIIDCQVESDWAMPACEIFNGGSNYILRFTGRNSYLSVNSSTDFYVEGVDFTINEDSAYNYQVGVDGTLQNWTPFGTFINLNTNIANQQGRADPTATGTLLNSSVVIEGMMNGDVNGRNRPITVAPGYANVMIKDCYIEAPAQQSGSWSLEGIACDGDGMTVSGTRVVGFSVAGDNAIDAERAAGFGRVVDCIGENITGRVQQRNVTNAQYTAAL
jgi:hypothetical protein